MVAAVGLLVAGALMIIAVCVIRSARRWESDIAGDED